MSEEKLCRKCGEYWPKDEDFFYRSTEGYFRSPCKACIAEKRLETQQKPCIVEGCPLPRAYAHQNKCKEHLKKR